MSTVKLSNRPFPKGDNNNESSFIFLFLPMSMVASIVFQGIVTSVVRRRINWHKAYGRQMSNERKNFKISITS